MATSTQLLGPIFALATWTALILLLVAYRRFRAGSAGLVHPREFALGESPKVPAAVALANRNYMNLLELPVLFYVVCLIAIVFGVTSPAVSVLAWLYVALRIVHSIVQVTYNRVIHRFTAFAASNGVLIALWVLVGLGSLVR
ncbi:MAG TPA: MAPEG family protein [Burkholderiaceae bacterium]|nr:MAPEG family protein [Burkholderiaceae bacterium]